MSDTPSTCEVAVVDGKVIINFQCMQPGCGKWGHLSFTPTQAGGLIGVLQQALSYITLGAGKPPS